MIEIKQLNKKQLLEYVRSPHFGAGDDIPITMHRALSQAVNPRLDEEDIIMLMAVDQDNLVGYLGVLPDLIFLPNRAPIKIGWLSCLWVSPLARGKGIGLKLITESLALWNNNILSADYVPATKTLYDRTNQFEEKPYSRKGIRLYIKSDLQHILPPKKAIFHKTKWLLQAIDFGANGLLNLRLKFFKEDLSHIRIEYIDHINDEVNDFILSKQERQLFKRTQADLNWIIQNPWILSADKKDDLNKKYYFSSTAKLFHFSTLVIRNSNNKIIAFLIFARRDTTLKLPYLYHDNCMDTVIKVINHHLIEWNIRTFTTFHPELTQHLSVHRTPALYTRSLERNYMLSSTLKDAIIDAYMEIQDGDGDCGFT